MTLDACLICAAGMAMLAPLLGGPRATKGDRLLAMHLSALTAILVTAAWMLAQYAVQVHSKHSCSYTGSSTSSMHSMPLGKKTTSIYQLA